MTLAYYTGEVREIFKQLNDDSKLDDRLIIRWLNSQRALWIKNKNTASVFIGENIVQTLKCVKLEPLSKGSLHFSSSTDKMLVSDTIPKFIEFREGSGAVSVHTDDIGGYSITIVPITSLGTAGSGYFNKADVYGSFYNGKLYIKVPPDNIKAALLTNVVVEGVFENPLQLASYSDCSGNSLYSIDDDDYPINDTIWEYVLGNIINAKYGIMLKLKESKENDNNSES